MKRFDRLNRAEMKLVLGGTMPVGGGVCSKDCVCPDGGHLPIKISNCDNDTCTISSDGVSCKVGGKLSSLTCANACPID